MNLPLTAFHSSRPLRIVRASALTLGLLLPTFAATPASAQIDTASGLRAKLFGASVNSVFGGDFDSAAGVGFGLEYRASRRLGFELTALQAEIESQTDFDFFGLVRLDIDSSLEVTPVLAQLDFHLTPDHRVDLHVGPIAGWMRYGDLVTQVRARIPGEETVETERIRTKDGFAWGAHLDFDVPFGESGVFFSGGATYLNSKVKAEAGQGDPEDQANGDTILRLDPLVLKVGLGYRF
jgi:outer membrane protein W